MDGAVTMVLLMWDIQNTFALIIEPTNLLVMVIALSMESNPFGASQKRRSKFNGVKVNFDLHLKECESRWKKEPEALAKELLKTLKKPSC